MEKIRALLLEGRKSREQFQLLVLRRFDDLEARMNELESSIASSTAQMKSHFTLLERKVLGSAGREVLRIPELVENILSHLQPAELLRIQTQSHFKRVTDGSLMLQRHLFLAPQTIADVDSEMLLNPFNFPGEQHYESMRFFNLLKPVLILSRCAPDTSLHAHLHAHLTQDISNVPAPDGHHVLTHKRLCARYIGCGEDGGRAKVFLELCERESTCRDLIGGNDDERRYKDAVQGCSAVGASWKKMVLVRPAQETEWDLGGAAVIRGTIRTGASAGSLMEEGTIVRMSKGFLR